MILYTFFEGYDFAGKTIVPFSTHGGSRFARTPKTIQQLEPEAKMLDGLTISRDRIQNAELQIVDWVNGLGL
jgi:flavodoxin